MNNTLSQYIDAAQSMIQPRTFHLKFEEQQIDITGKIIEPAYEMFVPAVTIRENGKLLYDRDATCIDSYHNETYTQGVYMTLESCKAYLEQKYADKEWEKVPNAAPIVSENFLKQWENPKYAATINTTQKDKEASLTRIVFQDKGTDKRGYHKIDFAYACDQKTFGQDPSIPNPYLMSSKQKGPDNKLRTVHSYYLSEDIYQRLINHSDNTGMKNGRWDGIIAANVGYPANRNGKSQISVDLTRKALNEGNIMKPTIPFNEKAHDDFIKASLAERNRNRTKQVNTQFSNIIPTQQTHSQLDK